jgi:glycerophosphoryl diester phosphodiesterase
VFAAGGVRRSVRTQAVDRWTVGALQHWYGLTVVPYTINDPVIMQRAIDPGVDGIITDDPDLLITVAIRNGLR